MRIADESEFTDAEVALGKKKGFELLDEYGVYEIEPRSNAEGAAFVDTTWAIAMGKDGVKCRLVGREYKWASVRTDVFAASPNPLYSRVVDTLSLKDLEEADPLVAFVADAMNAYYQVAETETFYVDPPPEWKAMRRAAGLDDSVVWRLKKQLPGRRAAGARWGDHVETLLVDEGWERYEGAPQFYKKAGTRLFMEAHMDDFHGVGRRSEVEAFLPRLRERMRLKASDTILEGAYEHLKRSRWKFGDHLLIGPHEKRITDVLKMLKLEGSKGVATPHLNQERPEVPVLLDRAHEATLRSCAMTLLYITTDRQDIAMEVNELSSDLKESSEHSWRKLIRVGRYLISHRSKATVLKKSTGEPGVINLDIHTDSDLAGDKQHRKSRACAAFSADGNLLAMVVRRESFIALSSTEAEFGAQHTGNVEGLGLNYLFEWAGFCVNWRSFTDNSAAKQLAYKRGPDRSRHMDVRLLWTRTQRAVKALGLQVGKVDGANTHGGLGDKIPRRARA